MANYYQNNIYYFTNFFHGILFIESHFKWNKVLGWY